MTVRVQHQSEDHRFEIFDDDELVGYADYHDADSARNFYHTVTLPKFRGRGLAAILTERALDDTRARGMHVIPSCWFVREFIESSGGKYSDLLAN